MRKTVSSLLAALLVTLFNTAAFSAVLNDEVTSAKLKEADGTASQDTNSGSGVKTGHIQNNAVTTAKIANNAVTNAKISGPISASKIEDGVFQKRYANVIVVAKSGGDYSDPSTAVSLITNASATNPYLVKLMPGFYQLNTMLLMKPYVDVEGSGRDVTTLSKASDIAVYFEGTGANFPSELRGLTIEDPSVTGYTLGVVSLFNAPAVSLRDLNIRISGPSAAVGIYAAGSVYSLDNVAISAQSTGGNVAVGILMNGCDVNLNKVTIRALGGNTWFTDWTTAGIDIVNSGSSVVIRNSDIAGAQFGINSGPIYNGQPTTFRVYNSTLSGEVAATALEAGSSVLAAGSEISGSLSEGTKLMNCFDGAFNTIPNQ